MNMSSKKSPTRVSPFYSVNRSNPDCWLLRFTSIRLETYHDWPSHARRIVDPCELAKAGLFYTGHTDRVQCAFCKGYLRSWIQGDIPLDEHRKHFPDCPFVRYAGFPGGSSIHTNPRHPEFSELTARIQSFSCGKGSPGQTAERLAEAGFYYVGRDDNIRCFCCDGGLQNLQPTSNALFEHARLFPHCSFVQKNFRNYQQSRLFVNSSREHDCNSRQITGSKRDKSAPVSTCITTAPDPDLTSILNSSNHNDNNLLTDNSGHNIKENSSEQVEDLASVAGDEGSSEQHQASTSVVDPGAGVEDSTAPSTSGASDGDFTAGESTSSAISDQLDVGETESHNSGRLVALPATSTGSSFRVEGQDQHQDDIVAGGYVAAGALAAGAAEEVAAAQLDVGANQQDHAQLPPEPFVDLALEYCRRLATYVTYPTDARPRPHILASCGFVYISGCRVRCTLCNTIVNIGLGVRTRNFNGSMQVLGIQLRGPFLPLPNVSCVHMPQY